MGIWIGFPTALAYQDIASMVSGSDSRGTRWNAVVERSVAGSVHKAEMPFADATMSAATMSGSGIVTPGIGAVAFRAKHGAVDDTPDEERVKRHDKRGRIVNIAPVAPPKSFSAGSVFERTSALLRPFLDIGAMAFADPAIKGKEIQIAGAFHVKASGKANPAVPAVIASLVNNDKADILATAYAPPAPDYAKASPFASLLNEDDNEGRFVPPADESDHAWVRQPLPPKVFSMKEQQCLAAGVYFEARGEAVKGQAAVAQVILNRVRNPTYPNTICGVVYQNEKWRNRCQFSFACDGIKDRVASPSHWKTAEDVAMAVTAGKVWLPEIGSSTHYHATYVKPRWARTMEKMKKIGQHIFYRTHGGGWS
jgi:spore germination cell wall hydrolase CwlJ-like protein